MKLTESMNKLNLDNNKILGKHLTDQNLEDLLLEKKKVKNELKVYDQAFMNQFQRAPGRNEKEPMRNLYMYYKRLKQHIHKKQALQRQIRNSTQTQSSSNSHISLVSSESASKKPLNNPEDATEESKNMNEQMANLYDKFGGQNKLMKQLGVKSKLDVQHKLQEIKNQRKELRTRLDEFQKNFIRDHNRKIRYTKDIAPVAAEFKRYKDLKADLSKLESLLVELNK